MGFKVVLRQRHMPNHFRQFLLAALNSGQVDRAIVCSGFFQERQNYALSTDTDFTNALINNSISLVTLGIHNYQWRFEYDAACVNLFNCGVNISSFISRRYHWHGKIFIAYTGNIPVFAIVGSSNMTNPAFGGNPGPNGYNYEADVIFWNSRYRRLNRMIHAQTENNDNELAEVFQLNYLPRQNGSLSIQDRLNMLSNTVESELENSDWIL